MKADVQEKGNEGEKKKKRHEDGESREGRWKGKLMVGGKDRQLGGKGTVRQAGRGTEQQRRVDILNTKHFAARLLNKITEPETFENDQAHFSQCR